LQNSGREKSRPGFSDNRFDFRPALSALLFHRSNPLFRETEKLADFQNRTMVVSDDALRAGTNVEERLFRTA